MRNRTNRLLGLVVGIGALALTIAGCGGGTDDGGTTAPPTTEAAADQPSSEAAPAAEDPAPAPAGDQITITLAIWDDWGLDELVAKYEAENPGIKINVFESAGSGDSRDNLFTKLAAGSGLSDVEAIESGWVPAVMEYPEAFYDLKNADTADRFLDWKSELMTTPDGRLIGLGTDIGPEAICYRADLFEAAGLPTDREAVAELLGGADATWDKYFEVGRQFVANSDVAWFDAATQQYNVMINQLANPYESDDNEVIALDNPDIKTIFDQVLKAAIDDDLSAHIGQWSEAWAAGFQNGDWATMSCPAWMLGTIEGNAAGVTGWDVADVYPNGGGSLGGSFLAVPTQTEHPDEAIAFAQWLTAPEQQVDIFYSDKQWPSAKAAQTDPELLAYVNPFFNNAPVGQIMGARAQALEGVAHMGPLYNAIHDLGIQAIARVDVDKAQDAAASWTQFQSEIGALLD